MPGLASLRDAADKNIATRGSDKSQLRFVAIIQFVAKNLLSKKSAPLKGARGKAAGLLSKKLINIGGPNGPLYNLGKKNRAPARVANPVPHAAMRASRNLLPDVFITKT